MATVTAEPAAWPPAARASIAPAAVTASATRVARPGLSTAASAATPVIATATASSTNFPPASDESSVPSGTPTDERSARVIATTPSAASAHAAPRSHGRAFAFGPNASSPVTAAPNSTTSPT